MGFGQGLSGLNAAAQELDIIGNNIANSGTVGFKSASATFADVYASSKVGLGVQVASVNQRFTVGTVSGTGNQFDMAIDGPSGLFRVLDSSGNVMYTRNGQFYADKDNNIVNAQGYRLTGFGVTGTDLNPIKVPVGNIDPQVTTTIATKTNLDANAAPVYPTDVTGTVGEVAFTSTPAGPGAVTAYYRNDGTTISWYSDSAGTVSAPLSAGTYTTATNNFTVDTSSQPSSVALLDAGSVTPAVVPQVGHPFSPTDPKSYTHPLPITVYDSLGNAHSVMQYFVKRPAAGTDSTWDVYYTVDGRMDNITSTNPSVMTFDSTGRLKSGDAATLSFTGVGGTASPAADMTIALSFADSTQFGGDFSPNFVQNGFPTGEYAGMTISTDGAIVANYTNGETKAMGYVALANFNNLQGLQPVGGNAWVETGASGQPIVGRPGTNSLASIKGQAVEESNVDMSQELVNMIIAQRTYQANAQTIKTQDQVLQTLISMR
jgi:flagellar hook protein FlgE